MKHIARTTKMPAPAAIEDALEDLVNEIACEINPDKDKCQPEKSIEWPW